MEGGKEKKGIVEKLEKQVICKEDIQEARGVKVNMMKILGRTGLS